MDSFENVVKLCKNTGDYMPAWETFVNTDFFVPVIQNDEGPQTTDFKFFVTASVERNGEPLLIVSEVLERLAAPGRSSAIRMKGAKLVEMLHPEVTILVALSDSAFGMPPDLLGWLRNSMQPA